MEMEFLFVAVVVLACILLASAMIAVEEIQRAFASFSFDEE